MHAVLRCAACGDAIGTYEPLVVVTQGVARGSALAREPDLAADAEAVLHRSCAEEGRAEADYGLDAETARMLPR